jgi:hypothetical protein
VDGRPADAEIVLDRKERESAMADPVEALILDLLEWIGPRSRAYSEVMDAWRTSCPRLPVWEDANERGFIWRHHADGLAVISVTAVGREFLARHRPSQAGLMIEPPRPPAKRV